MLWIPQSVPEITKYKIHFNHSREIEFLPLQVKFLASPMENFRYT